MKIMTDISCEFEQICRQLLSKKRFTDWGSIALCSGILGIDEGIRRRILNKLLLKPEAYFSGLGSFEGLAFLGFISLANKDILSDSEENEIHSTILKIIDNNIITKKNYTLQDCEVINGLSGILSYAISSPDSIQKHRTVKNIIIRLESSILKDFVNDEKGEFNLSMSHGLAGILSSLCISTLSGYNSPNTHYIIKNLSDFLCYFSGEKIPAKVSNKKAVFFPSNQFSWCYGSIGLKSALINASKAIQTDSTIFVKNDLINYIKSYPIKNIDDPYFCHGKASIDYMNLLLKTNSYVTNKENCNHVFNEQKNYSFLDGICSKWIVNFCIEKQKRSLLFERILLLN
jgi:lantibiotic modifying enzyme